MPQLHEQATLSEAAVAGSAPSGRMTIQVLTPGQGSSGYYSPSVCESAAPLVAAGTPMYLDHPTESDAFQRPERSLRDLAAVFTEAGHWDPTRQAVVAEAQVFAPYREVLSEMAPFIGVSVRGDGEISEGTVDGVRRRVVESISSISSVDFVTSAGRGGKVLQVLESTRAKLAESVSDKPWSDFTDADYTDEQYAAACVLDRGADAGGAKERYGLRVKEPSGTVNRNGVHAAAQRLGSVKGASDDAKTKAAKKLVGLYRNQLDEDPPASLLTAAGMTAQESLREAANVAQQFESRIHQHFTNMADSMAAGGRLTREERISLSGAIGDALNAFNDRVGKDAPHLYQRDPSSDAPNSVPPSLVRAQESLREASANDTQQALSDVVEETYGSGDNVYSWVRDYDPDKSVVYFDVRSPGNAGTYSQTFQISTDGSASLTGDRVEVNVRTTYVPVSPAGSSTTQESEEDTMPNIEEARLRELEEAAGRVQTLESERDTAVTERDQARQQLAESTARTAATSRARSRITEANGTLPATVVDRIVAEATRTVPLTEAGQLDEAAFDTQVDTARTAEETYLTGLAEANGAGRVTGLGGFPAGGQDDEEQKLRESNDKQRAGIFGRPIKEA